LMNSSSNTSPGWIGESLFVILTPSSDNLRSQH
jgi:hypothetical protein